MKARNLVKSMSPDYVYPEEEAEDQDWQDQDADLKRGDVDMFEPSIEQQINKFDQLDDTARHIESTLRRIPSRR